MEIKKTLLSSKKGVLIMSHTNPDYDAFGSGLAFCFQLQTLKIPVKFLIHPTALHDYAFLKGSQFLITDPAVFSYDVIVALDTASEQRVTHPATLAKRKRIPLINIDHHVSNESFGDINLIQEISSMGELLYLLFKDFDWSITPDVASCAYTALIGDTGGFRYSNVTAQTLSVASELVKLGADNFKLAQAVFENNSFELFQVLKNAIDSMVIDWNLKYAYTILPNTKTDYGQEVIDFIRSLENVNVVIVFRPGDPGIIRVSLRSKNDFNVSAFAARFGGGGHRAASGIKMKGRMSDIVQEIISALRTELA